MARWKLCASTTFEILPLLTCKLGQPKSYISKVVQPIFEIFDSARRCWGWAFEWKVLVTQVFYFCNGKVKTCASTTIEIFRLSTFTLCQQKSSISKGIEPIFEIFPSARRCWGWPFGWKVSGAQVFYFCNGNVKTLRIENIWNLATFNMYTVPAKILYLQRYLIDFRKLWLRSKTLSVGIRVQCFMCAGVLLLQWQCENFAHRKHLKSRDFQHVHCASKNPISPNVFNRFSKTLVPLVDVERGHSGAMFHVRRCFTFAMAMWKLAHRQQLKFFDFQHLHCASKNPLSPKVLNRFSKSFHELEDVEGGHSGGKFQVRRCFTFAMVMWKLCASKTFEISRLSTCTLCQQKSYISKGI